MCSQIQGRWAWCSRKSGARTMSRGVVEMSKVDVVVVVGVEGGL